MGAVLRQTPARPEAAVSFKGKKCPKCGRKGLHYAMHPHAFGYKDYSKVECRFCHARFIPLAPRPR